MTTAAAILLIAVPVMFNVAFAELGRTFSYPDVLRRPASEVLDRVRSGGTGLVMRWWALMLAALFMVPLVVLTTAAVPVAESLATLVTVTGVLAALVQVLGLVRWVHVVPWLAERHATADAAERAAIEGDLALLNRLLGVGIGEHLGYLLTGTWTVLLGVGLLSSTLPLAIGVLGIAIGTALALCSLEFVARSAERGWRVAEFLTPFAYIAWSLWLVALGVLLLVR